MSETLSTLAIVLSVLFVFIILFVLLHKRGHNKKLAQQKLLFADTIYKNKLEISEKETINSYLLAIDKINFTLLYINFSGPEGEVVLIDLWRIRSAKVITEDNSVYEQRKGKSVLVDKQVSKLQLEVTLVDAPSKTNLVLFEYKDGIQDFIYIKERADYWCRLINKSIQELAHPLKQKVTKV